MERTESIVVEVTPDYENESIKEREMFGWSLQGRQEIHEEGNAYGYGGTFNGIGSYTTVVEVSKYVKLHFVRPLSLPNLDRIKQLETQYFNMVFPQFPRLIPGGILGFIFVGPFLPFWFFCGYLPRKAQAKKQLEDALQKRKELRQQAAVLGQTAVA